MKVVLEDENSTFDLRWILNLNATLQKSATVNSSVTLALLSGKTNIIRIRSLFLPLWHLILLKRLHHRLMSSMYFLCPGTVICVQATVTAWALPETACFSASEQEILGRCKPTGVGCGYWNVLNSLSLSAAFMFIFSEISADWVFLVHKGLSPLLTGIWVQLTMLARLLTRF